MTVCWVIHGPRYVLEGLLYVQNFHECSLYGLVKQYNIGQTQVWFFCLEHLRSWKFELTLFSDYLITVLTHLPTIKGFAIPTFYIYHLLMMRDNHTPLGFGYSTCNFTVLCVLQQLIYFKEWRQL